MSSVTPAAGFHWIAPSGDCALALEYKSAGHITSTVASGQGRLGSRNWTPDVCLEVTGRNRHSIVCTVKASREPASTEVEIAERSSAERNLESSTERDGSRLEAGIWTTIESVPKGSGRTGIPSIRHSTR